VKSGNIPSGLASPFCLAFLHNTHLLTHSLPSSYTTVLTTQPFNMPADSLLDMARRVAGRNVHKITDIGDVSYNVIRPVLLKIESPEQLVSRLSPIPPPCRANPRLVPT
jgi:hypothetical protein